MKVEMKESEVAVLKLKIEDYNKLIESATRSLELSKGVLRNEVKSVVDNPIILSETKVIEGYYKVVRLSKEELNNIQ